MKEIDLNQTVKQAIVCFYEQHDFGDDGGINERFAWIKFGFLQLPIPNPESRKSIVYLHDVSHIVTGNDTTWKGESAVSAWEVGSGGWRKLYTPWFLTLWAMGLGVIFYPQNVLDSFKQGQTMNNALTSGLTKDEILNMRVFELREFLSEQTKPAKMLTAWLLISLVVFFTPFLLGIFIFSVALKLIFF
jgi:hypothetical protein